MPEIMLLTLEHQESRAAAYEDGITRSHTITEVKNLEPNQFSYLSNLLGSGEGRSKKDGVSFEIPFSLGPVYMGHH